MDSPCGKGCRQTKLSMRQMHRGSSDRRYIALEAWGVTRAAEVVAMVVARGAAAAVAAVNGAAVVVQESAAKEMVVVAMVTARVEGMWVVAASAVAMWAAVEAVFDPIVMAGMMVQYAAAVDRVEVVVKVSGAEASEVEPLAAAVAPTVGVMAGRRKR